MNTGTPAALARPAERVRWIPRQHGAWAMLAVPFLLGIAASASLVLVAFLVRL